MTEVKDIVFEDYRYIKTWNETKIYFVAPKSYLNGKYPEADGCTFTLIYPGRKWNVDYADVGISPFKDYDNGRSDYDWCPYPCGKKFKQALYDIFGNRGKENV